MIIKCICSDSDLMFHSEYSNGWNSAAAILVTFKVSMNKTPVPPPVQLDHGWSRRLYPGDVQRVREADSIS